MTDLQPITDYQASESLVQEVTISEDGSAKDVSNATVSWQLLPEPGADETEALLSDDDAGVVAEIVDAEAGRIDVTIKQDTTDALGGQRLWQRLIVDDNVAGKQIWGSVFDVERR